MKNKHYAYIIGLISGLAISDLLDNILIDKSIFGIVLNVATLIIAFLILNYRLE